MYKVSYSKSCLSCYDMLKANLIIKHLFKSLVNRHHRHLSNIHCSMANTACHVCFIRAVNGCSKKRKKWKMPWKMQHQQHTTKLKQSIILQISVIGTHHLWLINHRHQAERQTSNMVVTSVGAKKIINGALNLILLKLVLVQLPPKSTRISLLKSLMCKIFNYKDDQQIKLLFFSVLA